MTQKQNWRPQYLKISNKVQINIYQIWKFMKIDWAVSENLRAQNL